MQPLRSGAWLAGGIGRHCHASQRPGAACALQIAGNGTMSSKRESAISLAAHRAMVDAVMAYVPMAQRENARAAATAIGIGYDPKALPRSQRRKADEVASGIRTGASGV